MTERTRVIDLAAPDFYAVPVDATVEQAVEQIRIAPDKAVFYCYAVHPGNRLAGVVPIRKLVTASPGTRIADIMSDRVVALPGDGDRALLEDFFATYRFLAFPVIDPERRLLGVVQADTFSDQLMGEYEGRVRHDWLQLLGVSEQEEHARTLGIVKLRFPWLLVTVASGLLSAFISGRFHWAFERVIALSFFVPVTLLLSESVGMQTSAVMTSAMEENTPARLRSLALREIGAAALLGLSCGLLVGGVCLVWLRLPRFALMLSATLALTVTTASALAAAVPGLFRRFGAEPRLAAAPLTLAVTDNLTLFIYLLALSQLGA